MENMQNRMVRFEDNLDGDFVFAIVTIERYPYSPMNIDQTKNIDKLT